jgi:ribonuclease HII
MDNNFYSGKRPDQPVTAVKANQASDGFFERPITEHLAFFDGLFCKKFLCGMDEAGRGPLAGPLVAAAVILDPAVKPTDYGPLDDSKKLKPSQREEAFELIQKLALDVSYSVISPQEVDRLNPLGASMAAMAEAFMALKIKPLFALVDGNQMPKLDCPAETIVEGDGKSLVVAASSVVAKVVRDRLMDQEHEIYPQYGFNRNKGYGTKEHLAALLKYGPCAIHRLTFRGVKAQKPYPTLF